MSTWRSARDALTSKASAMGSSGNCADVYDMFAMGCVGGLRGDDCIGEGSRGGETYKGRWEVSGQLSAYGGDTAPRTTCGMTVLVVVSVDYQHNRGRDDGVT